MDIYLDNAATTPLCEAAIKAMTDAMAVFGNPSSTHYAGIEAKKLIDSSRKTVALALGCDPSKVVFTASGSEGNNQAIMSAVASRSHSPKRIITDDSEHPSVSETLAVLEKSGFEIIKLPTRNGVLDLEALKTALSGGAALVSIMRANNETGAVYDIPAVRAAIDASGTGALLHCDNVQGFLKTPPITKYCDFVTVSAHKINGPKGVGALYAASNTRPLINGGGQEGGRRSGTENTIGIAGFAAAAAYHLAYPELDTAVATLRNSCALALKERLGDAVSIHQPPERVGGMLSLSIHTEMGGKPVGSEVILNWLSGRRICVSAGSACHALRSDGRVLTAFGLAREEIASALRISFGVQNTASDADALICALAELCGKV